MSSFENKICVKCNQDSISERILRIIESTCYKCEKEMKIAIVTIDDYTNGPTAFNQTEIELAIEKGVLLKMNFSKTMQETYLANTCTNCNSFTGEWFLSKENIACGIGELSYNDYYTDVYSCSYCDDNSEMNYDDDSEMNLFGNSDENIPF